LSGSAAVFRGKVIGIYIGESIPFTFYKKEVFDPVNSLAIIPNVTIEIVMGQFKEFSRSITESLIAHQMCASIVPSSKILELLTRNDAVEIVNIKNFNLALNNSFNNNNSNNNKHINDNSIIIKSNNYDDNNCNDNINIMKNDSSNDNNNEINNFNDNNKFKINSSENKKHYDSYHDDIVKISENKNNDDNDTCNIQ
jgi:hypothetical protein